MLTAILIVPLALEAYSIIWSRHRPNSSRTRPSVSVEVLHSLSASSAWARRHWHVASTTSWVMKLNGGLLQKITTISVITWRTLQKLWKTIPRPSWCRYWKALRRISGAVFLFAIVRSWIAHRSAIGRTARISLKGCHFRESFLSRRWTSRIDTVFASDTFTNGGASNFSRRINVNNWISVNI